MLYNYCILCKMGYIYKITNTINNKVYIGQTKLDDPFLRWKKHIWAINNGNGCPLLESAVKKYGINNFKFEVLIICFDNARFELEKLYIKKYNSITPYGYNIQEGGMCVSFAGKKHTQETKNKIGYKNSNLYKNNENIKNTNNKINQKRKQLSEETKERISNSLIKFYKEHNNKYKNKEKISIIMSQLRGRKIGKYSSNNKLIDEYPTIIVAATKNGLNANAIQQCAAGRSKSSGGFIWKYADKHAKNYGSIHSFFK